MQSTALLCIIWKESPNYFTVSTLRKYRLITAVACTSIYAPVMRIFLYFSDFPFLESQIVYGRSKSKRS